MTQFFDARSMIGMQVCQHNQVNLVGATFEKALHVDEQQLHVEDGTRIDDDQALVNDKIAVRHGKAVGDGMDMTRLLMHRSWWLLTLDGGVHAVSPERLENTALPIQDRHILSYNSRREQGALPRVVSNVKKTKKWLLFCKRVCYN